MNDDRLWSEELTQICRIIKHFEFIEMGVAIELCHNCVLITGNDFVEIARPYLQTIRVARRYMANDMDLFIRKFGTLQLINKPLEFCCWIGGI